MHCRRKLARLSESASVAIHFGDLPDGPERFGMIGAVQPLPSLEGLLQKRLGRLVSSLIAVELPEVVNDVYGYSIVRAPGPPKALQTLAASSNRPRTWGIAAKLHCWTNTS